MKKVILLAVMALVSTISFAADRNGAYNTICKSLYNESMQLSCMQTVKTFTFFNDDALKICSALYNDSQKVACLTDIGDKDFEIFEIQQCGGLYNDSTKLECLQGNGTVRVKLPTCVKKEDLINLLKMSLDNLHAGNFSSVDSTLSNILTALITCQ